MRKVIFNEEKFEGIFKEYRGYVYGIARRYTSSRDDALDILQEVFVKVYTHFDEVESVGSLKGWLTRVTVNCCIDWLRQKKRKEGTVEFDLSGGGLEDTVSEEPQRVLWTDELEKAVSKAMECLSKAHRTVLNLWWKKELSYKEIAKSCGCSVGTVMSRLHYARRHLKNRLEAMAVV
ncbi:MAG: RNA polymerase sigma factor [Planctomycetota bacterium]|nr:RNA polymerase sigma factor [Planctomycetota bacterium]